jgi:hypothetical protein
MMDTSPLWLSHTLIAAVSFTAGVAVASLWWRHRCARLAAGEAQRRRDRAERIERVTAPAEVGGGKSRPSTPRIYPDPCLFPELAEECPPVDVGGRPLPPLPEDDVVEPWQKADRPKPPPGPDARLEPPQKRGITIKWVDPRTGYW